MVYPLERFVISRCRQHPHVMKEFIRFLMRSDAYEKYVLNYANASRHWKESYHCDGGSPHHLLMRAFLWSTTPERERYWENIEIMWRNKLKYDFKIEK